MDGRDAPRAAPRTAARVCRRAAAILAAALAAAEPARTQDASGYAELVAASGDSRTEDAAGNVSEIATDSLLQRYSFDYVWRPYRNFQMLTGGLFERDAATSDLDGTEIESVQRKIRPYLNALLRGDVTSATLSYYRNEDAVRTNGVSTKNIQEILNTTLGWRPEEAPSLVLRFIRTNEFEPDRVFQDTTSDLFDLVSEYRPVDQVQLYYRGALEELEDRVEDFSLRRTSHAGRITYSDAWWDQRLLFGAEYDGNTRETEVTTRGGGDILAPAFPLAGLFLLTDTPLDGTLGPVPGLIDGDETASAGIDQGLQPVGGDERLRNLGLDLGGGVPVNTIFVWVDRDLPPVISNSFSWDVYTSTDNLNWLFQETVAPAPFGAFDTRFEIRFAEVSTRYVKVVSRPLDRAVPTSDQFPDIFVTEITTALRTPAAQAQGTTRQTIHLLTTSLRARILDRPNLYYEQAYFTRRVDSLPSTYTLSNGFSLGHVFNPVYSVAARIAREDSREAEGDRLSYLYSASVRAVPYRTLQSSLVFSGRSSELEGQTSDSSSVFWYTTADLYRGISTNLGLGRSFVTTESGERIDLTQVNALATLVPHETTTLNLLYQSTTGDRTGGPLREDRQLDRRASEAGVTIRPIQTLYFFFSYRQEHEEQFGDRFTRSTSASWTPFPDGRLQVLFRFDDTYRSDLEAESRIFSPRVRWNVTDRWYVELAYEDSEFASVLDTRSSDVLTASTRIWF